MVARAETLEEGTSQFLSARQALDKVELLGRTRDPDPELYQNLQNSLEVVVYEGLASSDADIFKSSAYQLINFILSPATLEQFRGTAYHDVYLHIMNCLAETSGELFANIQIYPTTSDQADRQDNSLYLLNILLDRHDDQHIRQSILALYKGYIPVLIHGLLTTGYNHSEALAHILKESPDLLPEIIELLGSAFILLPPQTRAPKWFGLFPFSGHLDLVAERITLLSLSWFGFTDKEAKKLLTDWEKDTAQGRALHPGDIHFTLLQMGELEKIQPGIIIDLFHNFGIRAFGRYPTRMLLESAEAMAGSQDNWILIINPASDHNGSFQRNIGLYNNILEDLDSIQSNTGMRFRTQIVEYETPAELTERLNYAFEMLGSSTLIIWGSHGQKTSLNGGYSPETRIFRRDLQQSGRIGRIFKRYLQPQTTIILKSCSTGKKDGFAQTLSRLGCTVVAPDQNSLCIQIHMFFSEENLTSKVFYQNANTMVYVGGVLSYSYRLE